MKIGILQCDAVKPQFREQHGDYPAMMQSLFKQVEPALSFKIYDVVNGHYPTDLNDCDGYITTGSKASVYDGNAWIAELQGFISRLRQAEKRLIAICFGHQLVAQAFGGQVEKSEQGWGVGVHVMAVKRAVPWMEPPLENCHLLVSHQDQVVELPTEAALIAGSAFCPHAMFQLGSSILAIQGHPEFTKPYARALIEFRRHLLGEAVYTAAIESLQHHTDEQNIARWMIRFITRTSSNEL